MRSRIITAVIVVSAAVVGLAYQRRATDGGTNITGSAKRQMIPLPAVN